MGKSFELLGLAAFNVFLAIILSATFLTNSEVTTVHKLTHSNVKSFINEVAEVSGGKREDMDSYSITTYFMDHIAEHGQFTSTIEYKTPDMRENSRTMEMDKMNYISHVLQGTKAMNKHESAVQIDYIKVAENGRKAEVVTTNYERGVMPVDEGFGEARMVPVTGVSYCEQEVMLSGKNIIQMTKAKCSTNINFAEAY